MGRRIAAVLAVTAVTLLASPGGAQDRSFGKTTTISLSDRGRIEALVNACRTTGS